MKIKIIYRYIPLGQALLFLFSKTDLPDFGEVGLLWPETRRKPPFFACPTFCPSCIRPTRSGRPLQKTAENRHSCLPDLQPDLLNSGRHPLANAALAILRPADYNSTHSCEDNFRVDDPSDLIRFPVADQPEQEVLPPASRPSRVHQVEPQTDARGHTFEFPKVDLDEIEMMASVGMTTQQIAEALHIAPSLFGRMQKNDPYIVEAVDRGKARGVKMVTDSLFQNAMKGNVAAQIFWLKNRGAWQDKQELDQNLKVETKMSFDDAISALKAAGIDPSKV